jgi:hypothetical protein
MNAVAAVRGAVAAPNRKRWQRASSPPGRLVKPVKLVMLVMQEPTTASSR